jgi:hypothetical protein
VAEAFQALCDDILEANVAAARSGDVPSSFLTVDWTDAESFSEHRPKPSGTASEEEAGWGIALGDVICDSGYAHRVLERFALPLQAAGARLVADGQHRIGCQALSGKVRCSQREATMSLSLERPEVLTAPEHPPAFPHGPAGAGPWSTSSARRPTHRRRRPHPNSWTE